MLEKEKDKEVRTSAILGLGICGDPKGCEYLSRNYDSKLSLTERAYANIAFGLARYKPALKILADQLPKNAQARGITDQMIAAVVAIGLMGPLGPRGRERAQRGAPRTPAQARQPQGQRRAGHAGGHRPVPHADRSQGGHQAGDDQDLAQHQVGPPSSRSPTTLPTRRRPREPSRRCRAASASAPVAGRTRASVSSRWASWPAT